MSSPRWRPRSADSLELATTTEAAEGTERVGVWALPSSVHVVDWHGESAVRVGRTDEDARSVDDASARTALARLRRLEEASDARIRDFVLAFGSLFDDSELSLGARFRAVPYTPYNGLEATRWYREMGSLVNAALRVASALQRRVAVRRADVALLHRRMQPTRLAMDFTVKRAVGVAAAILGNTTADRLPFAERMRCIPEGFVNWWLRAAHVRPVLTWEGQRPRAVWTGQLWGLIGAQLLSAIVFDQESSRCDGCGRPVARARRAKARQSVWCGRAECVRLKNREAKRRAREKRGLDP